MKFSLSILIAIAASTHAAVLGERASISVSLQTPKCVPGPRVYNLRLCTVSCGVDRPGGDYGLSQTNSFEACVQACSADPKCVTAQYHEDNGFCYFKNTKNAAVSAAGEDTVDCAGQNGSPCSTGADCTSLYCNSKNVCAALL